MDGEESKRVEDFAPESLQEKPGVLGFREDRISVNTPRLFW